MLLALGIYASNRLMSYWILKDNLQETLANFPEALSQQRLGSDLKIVIEARGKKSEISGMRLSAAPSETTSSVPTETKAEQDAALRRLRAALSKLLEPSQIMDIVPAGISDLEFPAASPLAKLTASSALPAGSLEHTIAQLAKASGPVTRLALDWRGVFSERSYVLVPLFHSGKINGALVVLADHSPRIAANTLTTTVGTAIVAILCLASFLFAGFLLWVRFRDQVKTNQHMEYMAHHDALTGLPNRAVFNAQLTEALRLVHAKATNMGIMLIDVDKFKEINDTHGHGTGDIFLQVIAERLRSVFGDHLVARLSGDEFAVMIKSVSDVGRLTKLAADMNRATVAPCNIDGKEIKISLSIGIARASDGSWRSSRVLHCADLALYRAKHSGRSTFAWYTSDMDADAQKRKEIEEGLEKALRLNQFQILYQPQYSLSDNKLKGYESLIRWHHPTKGTISPELFIPVAEDCGLIEDIGDWVLFNACHEAAGWEDKSLRVAVNVSAAQFKPQETERKVAQALAESGLAPERLEIEITESLLIANTDAVVETLNKIREMGVSIAMDDFGTGYSSLSYLSRFPFDKIKIDRTFIRTLGQETSTDAIVTAIIGLGRSLDVQITAEGVENMDQVILLRAAGCDLVQGYLYGRPGQVSDAPSVHVGKMGPNNAAPDLLYESESRASGHSDADVIGQVNGQFNPIIKGEEITPVTKENVELARQRLAASGPSAAGPGPSTSPLQAASSS
ncbi:putative bifunctional diguanylate cyclase/phosphodiesterase [Roseibium limicola]|uniref:EAL domain-containing protein n=1 Tax=Roseibium limicola TaxID=2816037 RepID=A0A939EKY6_9HYPH|nr:EAL domain-containing protein [Roseibium limicola]MBO0343712.1 EAL domain-containing protein [Roseibium limicola]